MQISKFQSQPDFRFISSLCHVSKIKKNKKCRFKVPFYKVLLFISLSIFYVFLAFFTFPFPCSESFYKANLKKRAFLWCIFEKYRTNIYIFIFNFFVIFPELFLVYFHICCAHLGSKGRKTRQVFQSFSEFCLVS